MPKGRVLCAAVNLAGFILSPLAVIEVSAYQEAVPQLVAAKAEVESAAKNAAEIKTVFMRSKIGRFIEVWLLTGNCAMPRA